MRSYDNPYQGPRRVRTDWTRPFKKEKSNPSKTSLRSRPRYSFSWAAPAPTTLPDRVIPQATASIFQKLGLDFGILGENELCCGSTAMRLGDAEAFKRVAEANLETFRKLHQEQGVETIVTSCAGCYRAILKDYSLSDEYEQMMEGINVIHTVPVPLRPLSRPATCPFTTELPWKVTYHDPCHSGRHLTKFQRR